MYWYVLYVMVCTGMHLHVLKQIVHIDEYWLVLDCICVYWYLLTVYWYVWHVSIVCIYLLYSVIQTVCTIGTY